jgi:hypothetical protein
MKEIIVGVAVLLAVLGNAPYLRDVFKKKIEPHAYTWMVWSIVSAVVFFGQVAKGAGIAAIATGAAEIFTIIIFFFSLKNGFKHVTWIDTVFLIIALLGLIPWALTHDPTISVIIAVGIDLVAFVPTLRKTWQHPKTETPVLYGMNVLRHGLILVTLDAYNIATTLHSISMITTNTLMVYFIKRHKKGSH